MKTKILAAIISCLFITSVVCTSSNGTSGYTVTTIAGDAGTSGSTDGSGTSALFKYPGGITTDGTNLYVTDYNNHTIRQIVISSGAVTTIAGTVGTAGAADDTGTAATFNFPGGITTDGTNLYVADSWNHTIRQIVISTGVVTTVAGSGTAGTADGTGAAAEFDYPLGITTDDTNLYVTDSINHTIRQVVIATGVVTTIAGTATTSGTTDGTGTAALFNSPAGITTDLTNLYVADSFNHTIRQIVISTGVVTTLAGTASIAGSTNDTGTAASFNYPKGITTDNTNLFVVDSNNHTIRQVVISTGEVTEIAGKAETSGSADGTGEDARFLYPKGIVADGTDLYVTDTNNHTVRKLAP
jgi:sugar lactone lactonase YvrE